MAEPSDSATPSNHPSQSADRLCLSLRVLAQEAEAGRWRAEVNNLAGLGWLEGYVMDPENSDVVLIGRRLPTWPSLTLDDLAVNIRNVWGQGPQPYCSLDPRPEDVLQLNGIFAGAGAVTSVDEMRELFARIQDTWGPQTVVVGGVPRHSRHAHVMIEADYHMKKLSQGLAQVAGIPSCLDLVEASATASLRTSGRLPPLGLSMSRFWFHVGKGEPTFEEREEGIVLLDQCSVVVLTEKQRANADGALYDCGGDDPHAQAFARHLSERYEQAATMVPVYADLENLFRLSAVLRSMREKDATGKAHLNLGYYLRECPGQAESPMPPSLPGLVNHTEVEGTCTQDGSPYTYVLMPMVCGGVSMEMPVRPAQFRRGDALRLDQLRLAVIQSRPSRDAVSWPLPRP